MNLSALDIRKHEFKRGMRGFDPDEVSSFLDMVSVEYENLVRDNAMLREKVNHLNKELKNFREIEETLQQTLLNTERSRKDMIETAKRQADSILQEAETKAASLMEEGRRSKARFRSQMHELKMHKASYLKKIKALIKSQLDIFEGYDFPEEEFLKHLDEEEGRGTQPSITHDTHTYQPLGGTGNRQQQPPREGTPKSQVQSSQQQQHQPPPQRGYMNTPQNPVRPSAPPDKQNPDENGNTDEDGNPFDPSSLS